MSLLLIIISSFQLQAGSFYEDLREFRRTEEYDALRNAYREYRRQRREGREGSSDRWVVHNEGQQIAYLSEIDSSNDDAMISCSSCPSIKKLAGEVNNIVRKIADEHSSEYPALLGEVGQLEGMYYVTMENVPDEENRTGEVKCKRHEMDSFFNPQENDFSRELGIVIWDETIDMNKIGSIQMRMAGKRIYYFKSGPKDKEKVIRVEVTGKDKAKITYFHMIREGADKPMPLSEAEIKMNQDLIKAHKREQAIRDANAPKPKKNKNLWGYDSEVSTNLTSDTNVEGSFGFGIEHKHGLPRQINVLDIRSTTRFGDNYKLKTHTVLNSRDQEVKMSFGDENRDFVEVEVDGSDAAVKLPYDVRLGTADLKMRGSVIASTKYKGVSLSLLSVSGASYADLEYKYDDEKTLFSAKHKRKALGGTVSIGIQNQEYSNGLGQDETRVWAGYSIDF
ncbi:MAG: hypothetical protein KC493_13560 [Bacteriovoracaceae bacterium]|nr:hypothetical protein [Bacteriovoracaceae bacterium]